MPSFGLNACRECHVTDHLCYGAFPFCFFYFSSGFIENLSRKSRRKETTWKT